MLHKISHLWRWGVGLQRAHILVTWSPPPSGAWAPSCFWIVKVIIVGYNCTTGTLTSCWRHAAQNDSPPTPSHHHHSLISPTPWPLSSLPSSLQLTLGGPLQGRQIEAYETSKVVPVSSCPVASRESAPSNGWVRTGSRCRGGGGALQAPPGCSHLMCSPGTPKISREPGPFTRRLGANMSGVGDQHLSELW